MRILFLNDFIPPRHVGGPGLRNFEITQVLKEKGNDIFFITSCQDKKMEGEENKDGIKIFNVYSKYNIFFRHYASLYNFRTIRKIEEIMKKIKPDIVHADTIHTHLSYASLKIAKKYSRAVFLTARDFMLFTYGKFLQKERKCGNVDYNIGWFYNLKSAGKRYNPFRNFFIKRYLRYVDKIFCVSKELEKALNQNGITDTAVIHNGLPVKEQKKYQLPAENSKTVFLYGRINEAKGAYVLLEAFSEISKKVPGAKLIMAGATDEEKLKIDKKISDFNLKNIEVFSWIRGKEIEDIYNSVSVVASPSLYPDPFPGVNLEAALHGKPAVTTCFGGAKEFVIDGETGYVVNPFDKKELAGKIIDLLLNKDKAKKFGEATLERLEKSFTSEKNAEILLGWYAKFN